METVSEGSLSEVDEFIRQLWNLFQQCQKDGIVQVYLMMTLIM